MKTNNHIGHNDINKKKRFLKKMIILIYISNEEYHMIKMRIKIGNILKSWEKEKKWEEKRITERKMDESKEKMSYQRKRKKIKLKPEENEKYISIRKEEQDKEK